MNAALVHAFGAEWLKRKRSFASWLVVGGSLFTPAVVTVVRLLKHRDLPQIYSAEKFWPQLWTASWESMAIFFLPMGAILATSLMAQIEWKNNTWKQVHALPISLATIFFAKLAVVLVMMTQFFVLFTGGIYLSAVIPYLLVTGVPYPPGAIPYWRFLHEDLLFFVDCLPIVGAQYLLSVRFKNFLVPIGLGFLAWVGALAALPWKFGYVIPYTYCMLDHLKDDPKGKAVIPDVDIHALALGYFCLFTIAGFWLFATKPQKG
jgi:hypothetical protein